MVLLTTTYGNFLDRMADIAEDLVDDLVLDKKSREEVLSEYYTQEDIDAYWFNRNLSDAIDKAEDRAYSHLDESILPNNFWNE